jgi:hypothetical protein
VVTLERGPALKKWDQGRIQGPWSGQPSGATGRPDEVLALVLGDVKPGRYGTARVEKISTMATHSFVRLSLEGPLDAALDALSRKGHRVAGKDPRTAKFFAEKAGLVRPFVHVSRSGTTRAPLHGDLKLALGALDSGPSRPGRSARPSRPGPNRKKAGKKKPGPRRRGKK